MAEYAVMPFADYQDACKAIREKDGSTDIIVSGNMGAKIRAIKAGGFPNGTEWTASNIASGNSQAVAHGGGLWVAGLAGTGFLYSVDGKTWTQSNITSGIARDFLYSDGLWVAASSLGLYSSLDGKTWTQSNHTSYMTLVHRAGSLWFAGGLNTGLCYSEDGKTWTQSNITTGYCNAVLFVNGLWVTGAESFFYSEDGKTWVDAGITYQGDTIRDIIYADGVWFAVAQYGVHRSYDGKAWTLDEWFINEVGCTLTAIIYSNGVLSVGGQYCGVFYSEDRGQTWEQSNDTSSNVSESVSLHDAGISLFGTNAGVIWSTDGETWSNAIGCGSTVRMLCHADGLWVAATSAGLYYSPTWEPET